MIEAIDSKSAAEQSGLKEKDVVLEVDNNNVVNDPQKAAEAIAKASNDTIKFLVLRDDKEETIEVVPKEQTKYVLGIYFKEPESSIKYAALDTMKFACMPFESISMLFTGKANVDQLVGPIGISEAVAKTKAIEDFVYMLALISMAIGVTNLLPFPPLDGGKVVLLIVEAIRKKPLSEKFEIRLQTVGFALLILLSIYVAFNDVIRAF